MTNGTPIFCTNCGSTLESGYRFCGTCGHPAADSTPKASVPQATKVAAQVDEHATIIDDMSAIVAESRAKPATPAPTEDPPPAEEPAQILPPRRPEQDPPVVVAAPLVAGPPPAAAPWTPEHVPPQYPPPPPYTPPHVIVAQGTSTNGFAIASLVLGIVWLYWLGSLLALIFGAVALSQIRGSNGRQTGEGMAIAGLVLGIIGLAILLVLIVVGATVA
jgi:hypothetical protein